MHLPPLANLFAAHHEDPEALRDLETRLRQGGECADVWRPAPGWVAAAMPLPDSPPPAAVARSQGLAFAEGEDVVAKWNAAGPDASFQRVAGLADSAPEQLHRTPGDFGFIRFRPHGEATVVRSAGGLVPFYLLAEGGYSAVSTRLGYLTRYLPLEPRLDAMLVALFVTGHVEFADRRAPLAGALVVDRGSFAQLAVRGGPRFGRYWDPGPAVLPRPTPARIREHAERLRALLIRALERDLHPGDGNLLALSGGVDSSSVGALAAGVVGRKVWSWTFLPEPEEAFQYEYPYVARIAETFGFERRWILRYGTRSFLPLLSAYQPIGFPVIHPALLSLPGVAAEAPVKVLFGGEFADEVCGSMGAFWDWAASTSLLELVREREAAPGGFREAASGWLRYRAHCLLRRPPMRHPKDLGPFIRDDVRQEYREWLERRRAEVRRDRRPNRGLRALSREDGFVAMNWEATTAIGIRRSFPFMHRDILELAFECHPSERIGPGTKKILRTALAGDVPAENLLRKDKGQWGTVWGGEELPWTGGLPDTLRSVVAPDWFGETEEKLLPIRTVHTLARLRMAAETLLGCQGPQPGVYCSVTVG